MAITVEDFRLCYPEFTNPPYTDELIQKKLDAAQCDFSRSKLSNSACGENIYERIVFLLAAHSLTIWNNRQKGTTVGGGPIASKTVGSVSVSYARSASGSSSDDFFNQTIYGQEYLQLLNKYCPGFLTIC